LQVEEEYLWTQTVSSLLNTTLDEYLKSVGYRKSNADGCIYEKSVKDVSNHISFVILGVFINYIIPVSNNIALQEQRKLHKRKI